MRWFYFTLTFLCAHQFLNAATESSTPYGLTRRPESRNYLNLPSMADGALPPHLSGTGAFESTLSLKPADSLIPYDLIVSFWSDGAEKLRWVSVPSGEKIKFAPTGEWIFPNGTVFVKHF